MASFAPTQVRVNPSLVLPEVLLPYTQASGAFSLLPEGAPSVRLSDIDKAVYINALQIDTEAALGQSAFNALPTSSIVPRQISAATYLIRTECRYDHHDAANMGAWGINIVEAQRLAMRQSIHQQLRNNLLYGVNPANGEGLLNVAGATATVLPPDSNSHTTISTYASDQLAVYLLSQINAIKTRTMQIGMPAGIRVLTTQRILGALSYQNIVQLASYQIPGGGTATVTGQLQNILGMNGDTITFTVDDTLIGKGAGATDLIIIAMPEVKKPMATLSTNEFAKLTPGMSANIAMLMNAAAPVEFPTPVPGGATHVLSELRATAGWVLRPEALTLISAGF